MVDRWLYFAFPLLYLAHMHEEYWTGFTRTFPPPRLAGPLADRSFWVANPLLMNVATAIGVANLMGAEGAFFWAMLCASIFLWNAAAHGVWSALTRAYQPGLITGLLYAPLIGVWLWLTAVQGGVAWGTVRLALLIGLGIMAALAGAAVLGRRVLQQ
jgi:hypothetical protein